VYVLAESVPIPHLISNVLAALGPSADSYAAVTHHLMALIEASGHDIDPAHTLNQTLSRYRFSADGKQVRGGMPPPWQWGGPLSEAVETMAAEEDAAHDLTADFRPSRIVKLGEHTLLLYIRTLYRVVGGCGPHGLDPHRTRTNFVWVQSCSDPAGIEPEMPEPTATVVLRSDFDAMQAIVDRTSQDDWGYLLNCDVIEHG
jgi:hypothetical protein